MRRTTYKNEFFISPLQHCRKKMNLDFVLSALKIIFSHNICFEIFKKLKLISIVYNLGLFSLLHSARIGCWQPISKVTHFTVWESCGFYNCSSNFVTCSEGWKIFKHYRSSKTHVNQVFMLSGLILNKMSEPQSREIATLYYTSAITKTRQQVIGQ